MYIWYILNNLKNSFPEFLPLICIYLITYEIQHYNKWVYEIYPEIHKRYQIQHWCRFSNITNGSIKSWHLTAKFEEKDRCSYLKRMCYSSLKHKRPSLSLSLVFLLFVRVCILSSLKVKQELDKQFKQSFLFTKCRDFWQLLFAVDKPLIENSISVLHSKIMTMAVILVILNI